MNKLDRLLAALGRREIDRDLSALESAVWARIDARARPSVRPIPARMTAIACATVAMIAWIAGGAAALAAGRAAPDAAPFAIDYPIAPSTVLGG